jgi:SpoIID/LytB domain protein
MAPAEAAPAPPPAQGSVEVIGLGYGHGRGMGQWGAYGYAAEYGWGYRQILAHYYGGTTLGRLPPQEPDVTVSLDELAGRSLVASSPPGGLLVASWSGGGQVAAPALEVRAGKGKVVVYSSRGCSGPWRAEATARGEVTVASASPSSPAVPAGVARSEVEVCLPGAASRSYQGHLVVLPGGGTENVVGLEDYVDGVVPAESPVSWASSGGEAALEAQAVAARSYALAVMASSAKLCDTTACQVYEGLPGQYGETADQAVAATAGQVLYCNAKSSCGPAGSVALAEYSASTGGWTAGGLFPPVADLGDLVPANPVHSWQVSIPAARFERELPAIGTFLSVEVVKRNGLGQFGGRAEAVVVTGTRRSVEVSGYQFAADFSLRSDWFKVVPPATPPTATTTRPATTTTSPPPATTTTSPPPATTTTSPPPATTTTSLPPATTTTGPPKPPPGERFGPDDGFWVVTKQGYVEASGAARSFGSAVGTRLAGQVVAIAATPDYGGYWLAGRDGAVLAFGDARRYGPASPLQLRGPVVDMAATPDGGGYWLVTSAGAVYGFGDAASYGSVGGLRLEAPIAGFAPTPDGRGYWLVAENGGIYAFGDAQFYGSLAGTRLRSAVIAIVPTPDGHGYSLVASDGGVFVFGDASFLGSLPSSGARARAVWATPSYDGPGYYVLTASGSVYSFGGAALPEGRRDAAFVSGGLAVALACHRSADKYQ